VETADVVIAGAGIIGLSLALKLATRGLRVTVLERSRAMTESSWAAAGMLAARDPENPPQLAALAQFSLALYPGYLSQVEHLSARKVPLRTTTTLQASHPGESFNIPNQPAVRKLSLAELHAIEPNLHPHNREFLLLEEQSLDPRDLCIALPLAAHSAGVKLVENSPAISVDFTPEGWLIQTSTTPIAAGHFVNCAGAWAASPALGRLAAGAPAITPRKGQMVTVRLRGAHHPQLRQVLRTPGIYLVPRGEGRITIGATVERAGFDKSVEPRAIAALLQAAAELYPPIAHAEILESWAGLRPASADDLPLIGPLPNPPPSTTRAQYWIAAGHFRNGILLAPATARVLAQAICNEPHSLDLSAFDPARIFSRNGASPAAGAPLEAALK
jgi:glycine oxidase